MPALLELRENGLHCAAGDFFVDPWAPVDRAVITHAHADHARPGSRAYLTARTGAQLLRARVGNEPAVETAEYGERVVIGDVTISFHPAGHILGSAQVRIERGGEAWVVSGDYKLAPDLTCAPFEPVRCHTFVTESTFGLPIFRWAPESEVMDAVHAWWRANQEAGKTSLLYAYPVGKAQRLLAGLDASTGPIHAHGGVNRYNEIYRASGVPLQPSPGWEASSRGKAAQGSRGALILAPPEAHNSAWARQFAPASSAFVSGWMRIRGTRRRRSFDRGFVLSDHADWSALLHAIDETGAETIVATHGCRAPLVRWLEEHGRQSRAVDTRFEGEGEEAAS